MKKSEKPTSEGRRHFLRLAATAAPAVAVTSVAGGTAEASESEGSESGLRLTPHVQAYLDSARF